MSLSEDNKKLASDAKSDCMPLVKTLHENEVSKALIKQLDFMDKKYLHAMWPASNNIEYLMEDLFERLDTVREVNKKHI
jgi:hypothetical protein